MFQRVPGQEGVPVGCPLKSGAASTTPMSGTRSSPRYVNSYFRWPFYDVINLLIRLSTVE